MSLLALFLDSGGGAQSSEKFEKWSGTEKSLEMEDQRVDISPSKAARDFF